MSRVLLLNLSEAEAIKACENLDVRISVLEKLESGGVRLVCVTADGAASMRHKLRTKLIDGPVRRSRVYARGMQPFSSAMAVQPERTPFSANRSSR